MDVVGLQMAKADATKRFTRSAAGIILPAGWGSVTKAKKAAALAGTGLWRVAIPGTSIEQGGYSSTLANSWIRLLTADLQTTYGDGGSGFVSALLTPFNVTANAGAAQTTAWGSAIPSSTGTWSASTNGGPASGFISCNAATASGSTWTAQVRGSTVGLSFPLTTTGGTFTWTIDGAAQGSVTCLAGAATPGQVQVTGLSGGSHTVVVTVTGSSGIIYVSGAYGYNATGCVVDNYGHWGGTAAMFNNNESWFSGAQSGGNRSYHGAPADTVIFCADVNDARANTSAATWGSYVHAYLQGVTDTLWGGTNTTTFATDIALLLHPIGKFDSSIAFNGQQPVFAQYAATARGIAASYEAAVIDLWAATGRSYQKMLNANYMGSSATPGAAGTDSIHWSDAMHAKARDIVKGVLLAA